jgi:hypothetical protein
MSPGNPEMPEVMEYLNGEFSDYVDRAVGEAFKIAKSRGDESQLTEWFDKSFIPRLQNTVGVAIGQRKLNFGGKKTKRRKGRKYRRS